jgi:uncharacterized protein YciI
MTADEARSKLARQGHPGGPIFFGCFTRRGSIALREIERVFPAHKQWIAEQEAAGRIVVAGPFLADDLSWDGDGLIVFRAETLDEAVRLAHRDPMHAEGLRTFEIIPWQINEGFLNIVLTISGGTVQLS